MAQQNGLRDFESMTVKQRDAHYEAVCAAAGIDPALNLLKWTKMDSNDGSGEKRLVLYATKGATNAIRELQGIDITGLTDKMVANTYVVTASAKNKKGRTDHATGAASLEGKRGKQLENAFALAQTRATRRVTLQMSGLDLLDESEVTADGTTPIADAPLPLDQIGTPVDVNSEAGTDITLPAGLTLKPTVSLILKPTPGAQAIDPADVVASTPERLPNPAAGLKLATTNIAGPSGAARPVAAVAPPASVSQETQSEEAPKQRRKRRTKAEMEASRTEPIGNSIPKIPDSPDTRHAVAEIPESVSVQSQAELEPLPAEKPAPIKVSLSTETPTKEQMTVYVERLKKYREEILPRGGMVPSNGLGVNKKIRTFFSVANNRIEDIAKLTVAQWDATFAYMDNVVATKGEKELVAIIEANIVTPEETQTTQ